MRYVSGWNLNSRQNVERAMRALIYAVAAGSMALGLTACPGEMSAVKPETSGKDVAATRISVAFSAAAVSIVEGSGSPGSVNAVLSAVSDKTITVQLAASGTAQSADTTSTQATHATLSFAPGETSKAIPLQAVDDTLSEGDETVIMTLSSPTNAVLGTLSTTTFTIQDNDVASFNVLGVRGGGSDVTDDAYLVDTLNPTVVGQTVAGGTLYRARIYSGATELCSATDTTSTVAVTGCGLAQSTSYTVRFYVEDALGNQGQAANSPFTFRTNRSPVGGADGPVRIMAGSTIVALPVTTLSAAHGTIADSDPDADTLSISAVTQSSAGGVVTKSGVTVGYTPPSTSFTGVDTFTYTLSDLYGGATAVTVTVHVMSPATWTGQVSNAWADSSNWCGTIVNNQCQGWTRYPQDKTLTSDFARFDGTCAATGHSCDAHISAPLAVYGIDLASSYMGALAQMAGPANAIDFGRGGYTQSGGNFLGGDGNMALTDYGTSTVSITGGFYRATSGLWDVRYSMVVSGTTFQHNGGTLKFSNDCGCGPDSITATGSVFNNVTFDRSWGGATIVGTLQVAGDLSVQTANNSFGVKGGPIYVGGNTTFVNFNGSGNAPIIFNGIGTQTLSSFNSSFTSGDITIDKLSGVVELATDVTFIGGSQNLTITQGAIDMKGHNLAVTGALALTGRTLTKSGGVLTVGGSVVGSGALHGGTVAP